MISATHIETHLSSASNREQHWSGTALDISFEYGYPEASNLANNTSTASTSRSTREFLINSPFMPLPLALDFCLLSHGVWLVIRSRRACAIQRRGLVVGDAEKLVHSLQRQTLGLGHEEPDEEEHGKAEATEDEIRAVFTNQSDAVPCNEGLVGA